MESGRSSRYACDETTFEILYGPRFFQSSFLDCRFVRMLRASSQTESPILYAGAGWRFRFTYSY